MLCGLLQPSTGEIEVLGFEIPARGRGAEAPHRLHDAAVLAVRGPHGAREPAFLAAVHDMPRRTRARAHRGADRALLAQRPAQAARGHAVRRPEAAARARGTVLHKPELLFLDEPTSAVDPQSRREFWDSLFELADEGTTLLVSTHYMDEAERCTRLAILDRGRIVADGTPQRAARSVCPAARCSSTTPDPRRAQRALDRLRRASSPSRRSARRCACSAAATPDLERRISERACAEGRRRRRSSRLRRISRTCSSQRRARKQAREQAREPA